MNTIVPYFTKPISDFWISITEDKDFKDSIKFAGGVGVGQEWHTKYYQHERDKVNKEFGFYYKRFNNEPDIWDFLWDNKYRLTIFAGMERFFSFRQAQGLLKSRFQVVNTNTSVLTSLFNQGYLKGYFRGYAATAFQFIGIQYHALQLSQGKGFWSHYLYSSLLEIAVYPIDTIKTVLQSDINGVYKGYYDVLASLLENKGYSHLYRGLIQKLIYNGFFLNHLSNMYEGNNQVYVSLPLWILSYGLLTVKARQQVSDTKLSFQQYDKYLKDAIPYRVLFAGVVPLILLNTCCEYNLYSIYSQAAQDRVYDKLKQGHKVLSSGEY